MITWILCVITKSAWIVLQGCWRRVSLYTQQYNRGVIWALWRRKLTARRPFAQQLVQFNSKEIDRYPHYWHFVMTFIYARCWRHQDHWCLAWCLSLIFFLVSCVQHIPRNMHMVIALLCFVVVIHWLIFPYPSGLLHWHCGNLTIAPVPAKQPWLIWINTSCEFIMNDCITTTKQSTTKPCAYFLRYTVHDNRIYYVFHAPSKITAFAMPKSVRVWTWQMPM